MKRLIAIFLFLVYTCTGTTLQQLQKTPVLVEHFLEHRAITDQVTLTEFIILHYLSGNMKDADHDRDMQLPFKAIDFMGSATAPAFIPSFFPEITFTPPLLAQVHGKALDVGFSSSLFLTSIWQPPQSC